MTRHYDRPIQVVCIAADNGDHDAHIGAPSQLIWRETPYRVRTVLARWHLCARWWAEETEGAGLASSAGDGEPATDRFYFRLRCVPELICVVYYDAAAGVWRLEAVYD